VLLFTDPDEMKKMRLMMRYLASAENAWNKALAGFEKVRRERMQREREEAAVELAGFASQPSRLVPSPDNAAAILDSKHAQAYLKTCSATVEKWTASASS
jgi:hypothetical protein